MAPLSGNFMCLLAVAGTAMLCLWALDELIFEVVGGGGEGSLFEWITFGAFLAGLMLMGQRSQQTTAKKLAPRPSAPDAKTGRRIAAAERKQHPGGKAPVPSMFRALDGAVDDPADSELSYFPAQDVAAVAQACQAGSLPQAEEKFRDLLGRGPSHAACEGTTIQAAVAVHAIMEASLAAGAGRTCACRWLQDALATKIRVAARTVYMVMGALLTQPNVEQRCRRQVEELFMIAMSKGVSLDARCYQLLFEQCLPPADADGVEEWLQRAADGCARDSTEAFVGLIGSRSQTPAHQQAEMWLRRAGRAGIANLTPVRNAVLQLLIRTNNLNRAKQMLETMEGEEGGRPDFASYELLMSACAKAGEARYIMRCFAAMRCAGRGSEGECYGAVVKALARAGDLAGARKRLSEAQQQGAAVGAEAHRLAVVAASRMGEAAAAEQFLLRMLEEGLEPDTATCNAVAQAYAKSEGSDPRGAPRILQLMLERRIEPTVATLAVALHACARLGDGKGAEALFRRSVEAGVPPDAVCYNALIHACVKAGDVKSAERWLEAMLADGVEPSVVSFTTVQHAYARAGLVEEAERGMALMRANGVAPNVVSFGALVQACAKLGDVGRAERWFQEMRDAGVQASDVCYGALLDVCAKAGDWKRAEQWLAAMQDDGVAPSVVCFNSVINACTKASEAARAEAWLRRLLGETTELPGGSPKVTVPPELAPTRQSFTTAAQAYACCGSFGDVERIFADMQERGMSLDEFGLTVLLSAYSRARPRQRERAQLVFEEYVRGGGRVTAPPLRVLRTCLGAPLCSKLLAKLGLRQQASGDS